MPTMKTDIVETVSSDFTSEVAEWLEAFDQLLAAEGTVHAGDLLEVLRQRATEAGVTTSRQLTTHYCNTIPVAEELPYPGDRHIERRIKGLIRWNAMAMVHHQRSEERRVGK